MACYQQADIKMRLHGLRQIVDYKSVAGCLHLSQVDYQNLLSTGLLQVVSTCCKSMTSCNEPDFNKLVATLQLQF